jgi:branched-chain amino acid aminotransferase
MDKQGIEININGRLQQTFINVMDYGFLYGFGLFETMRAYDGYIFCLDRHLERMYQSAEVLRWNLPWRKEELAEQILKTLASVHGHNAYIRVTVTRGIGTGLDLTTCIEPSFVIMVRPYQPLPAQKYHQGWHLITSMIRRNATSPLSRVKSLNYADNLLAKQEARHKGADEALFLNEAGYVAECSTANVFLVKNGVLSTPCLDSGILNGITRQVVLELGEKSGIPVSQPWVGLADLNDADEIFCTNSLMEIMPVTKWDDKIVNQSVPGPVTVMIQEQYRHLVQCFIENEK